MRATIRLVDDEGRELASMELGEGDVFVDSVRVRLPEDGVPVQVRGKVTGHIVNKHPISLPLAVVDGVVTIEAEYVEIERPKRRRAKSSAKNPGAVK